jgi:hypothetical protein
VLYQELFEVVSKHQQPLHETVDSSLQGFYMVCARLHDTVTAQFRLLGLLLRQLHATHLGLDVFCVVLYLSQSIFDLDV